MTCRQYETYRGNKNLAQLPQRYKAKIWSRAPLAGGCGGARRSWQRRRSGTNVLRKVPYHSCFL